MKKVGYVTSGTGFVLAALSLTLGGCHSTGDAQAPVAAQPTEATIFADTSGSTIFIGSPTYTAAAIKRVGDTIAQLRLGDSVRIVALGSRTADRAVDVFSEASGYKKRLPAVRKDAEASLTDLYARSRQSGGDGATNIVYTLTNAHPQCANGGRILILSDGIEESEGISVSGALNSGKPVHMPLPATPILKGCSIEFIGLGMTPMGIGAQAQTLPQAQLQLLTAGWREWLQAAGVTDMRFTSIL